MWEVVGWSALFLGLMLLVSTLAFKMAALSKRADQELEQDDERA